MNNPSFDCAEHVVPAYQHSFPTYVKCGEANNAPMINAVHRHGYSETILGANAHAQQHAVAANGTRSDLTTKNYTQATQAINDGQHHYLQQMPSESLPANVTSDASSATIARRMDRPQDFGRLYNNDWRMQAPASTPGLSQNDSSLASSARSSPSPDTAIYRQPWLTDYALRETAFDAPGRKVQHVDNRAGHGLLTAWQHQQHWARMYHIDMPHNFSARNPVAYYPQSQSALIPRCHPMYTWPYAQPQPQPVQWNMHSPQETGIWAVSTPQVAVPQPRRYQEVQFTTGYDLGNDHTSQALLNGLDHSQARSTSARNSPEDLLTESFTDSQPQTPTFSTGRLRPRDQELIDCVNKGWSFKRIKEEKNFMEAESTLRGRYRNLTKPKEQRLRRPRWTQRDIFLLREAVTHYSTQIAAKKTNKTRVGKPSNRVEEKIPWKKVAEYIKTHGGSYLFGPTTTRKKWDEQGEA